MTSISIKYKLNEKRFFRLQFRILIEIVRRRWQDDKCDNNNLRFPLYYKKGEFCNDLDNLSCQYSNTNT
jgi:hypothetical protein